MWFNFQDIQLHGLRITGPVHKHCKVKLDKNEFRARSANEIRASISNNYKALLKRVYNAAAFKNSEITSALQY